MLSSVWRVVSQATLFLLLTLRAAASAAASVVLTCCCALATEVRRCVAGRDPEEALDPLLA